MTPEMEAALLFLAIGFVIGLVLGFARKRVKLERYADYRYAQGKADGWTEAILHISNKPGPKLQPRATITKEIRRVK